MPDQLGTRDTPATHATDPISRVIRARQHVSSGGRCAAEHAGHSLYHLRLVAVLVALGVALAASPAWAQSVDRYVVHFDRMKILWDGDPIGGAGELNLGIVVVHRSRRCDGQDNYCNHWSISKYPKAKAGETVNLRLDLPTPPEHIEFMPAENDMIEIRLSIYDADGLSYLPLLNLPVIGRHTVAHQIAGTYTVEGSTARDSEGKRIPKRQRVRYRLHYRIKPYEPDLKLVAFRTVPNVLNTAYTESRVCLQVASVGSHPTADYTPRIFLDNGGQPYHSLRRREGLGVFKREEVCETMPTPNVGQHSLRVQLDPEGLDHRLDNNRLVRNVHANKRLTHDQRWVRTNGQVGAYLRQVAELKNALQLVTVARARVSPRLRERRQTPPPPDLRADPQEILEMVRSVGRRTVLIQDEGAALRHAYVELERDAAAQEIANLLERANTLYPVTQDLQEYIRNNESEKIGQALESLTRGGPHMKERLTIAKKFWAR